MSFPNLSFWSNLLGATGIEVCVVVALGIAAQAAFRRAWWKRAMWQMTLLCLILVCASEWTGAGRGAIGSLFGPKRAIRAEVPLTISPNVEFYTPKGVNAISPPLPDARKAVWWPGWIWLAGTVLVLGRMAAAQSLLLVMRLRREKIVDDNLQERVRRIARMVGLRRNICLLRLPESISPMAFGVLFPTIGLPPDFETGFSAAEQDAILAHELAHLAVHDPLWFRVADFASALLWWHPLVWWARRSLHGASELAADEATALVPHGPDSLAHCLVALGKKMSVSRGWGWTGINGGFRSKLGKRVERLTRMSASAGRPFIRWSDRIVRIAATVLVVPSVVLLFGAFQTAHGERENALRDSWNSSPGVLLATAALDSTETPTTKEKDVVARKEITTQIMDAKLYYEMGKLAESKAILTQIRTDDPSNATAAYYLNLIKEAQFMDSARKRSRNPHPIPLAANDSPQTTTPGGGAGPSERPPKKEEIAERITNAKLLYEIGELAASKKTLTQVLKDDPTNQTAAYYLDMVKEAQFTDRQHERDEWDYVQSPHTDNPSFPIPKNGPVPTKLVHAPWGRQNILSKLETLHMDEVNYDLPLTEVVNRLRIESQKKDPDGAGINFLVKPISDSVGTYSRTDFTDAAPAGAIPMTVPATAPSPAVDMSTVKIKISPVVADIRLVDVLNAIVMCADQPIQYKVEDYGVVFSPKPAERVTLFSKTYHFDPNTFIQSVQRVTGATLNSGTQTSGGGVGPQQGSAAVGLNFGTTRTNTMQIDSMLRGYFESAGVDMTDPGKSLFFSDRSGLMLVRASGEDLEKIDKAVAALNQAPPQAVSQKADSGFPKPPKDDTLYSRAFQLDPIEFEKNLLPALGTVPGPDAGGTNDTAQMNRIVQAYFAGAGAKFTVPAESIVYEDRAGVLVVHTTAEKLKTIEPALAPLNQTPPQVTIETKFVDLSQEDAKALGYSAFLGESNTNLMSFMSDAQFRNALNDLKHNSHGDFIGAPRVTTLSGRQAHIASTDGDDGVALDVIPTVLADGYFLQMLLIPAYSEFLGNDPPGTFVPQAKLGAGNANGVPAVSPLPTPHFRLRQVVTKCTVLDGETVVTGQLVARPNSDAKKLRLVFVNTTIIDPVGNRVHTDEELSEKYKQAP